MDIALQKSEAWTIDFYWERLRVLSKTARLSLASRLTYSVLEEESIVPTRRTAKVNRKNNMPTDAQLEALMGNRPMPPIQANDTPWDEIIDAKAGKTIKPIEKWL